MATRPLPFNIGTTAQAGPNGAMAAAPGAAACLPGQAVDGERFVLPTRLVVLVIVIACYVGGLVALLQAGHEPLDAVGLAYLASGAVVEIARRVIGLMRRR